VSQVFTNITSVKKNQVETQVSQLSVAVRQMRLMIIATISACKRRRIVVKYNHDKQREIKKFQSSQSQFVSMQGDQAQAMAGVPNSSSGLENQYQQNFTMSNQQYLHDMHQQQEQI